MTRTEAWLPVDRGWLLQAWRRRGPILCALVALCSVVAFARLPSDQEAAIDEPAWVSAGDLAYTLLVTGAGPERWARAFDEQRLGDWGNKNPPLGKYIIGIATSRVRAPRPFRYRWDRQHAFDDQPMLPPPHLLAAARAPIQALGCAALVAAFAVAFLLTNGSLWALLAPVLLWLLPNFRFQAQHVYTDVPQLLLSLLAVGALMASARTGRSRDAIAGLTLSGLACAVKLSAGTVTVGGALYLLHAAIARKLKPWVVVVALLSAPAAFVAVNPYLYAHPLARSLAIADAWRASKREQQADPLLASQAITGVSVAWRRVYSRGIWRAARGLGDDSTALGSLLEVGLLLVVLERGRRRAGGASRTQALVVLLAATCAGALQYLLTDDWTPVRGPVLAAAAVSLLGRALHARDTASPFAYVLVTTFLLTAIWLPFDWERYYLPVAGLALALPALGAATLARSFMQAYTGRPWPTS